MNDKFTKFILAGILLCLIVIANKPANNQVAAPSLNIGSEEQVIQLAPNRIAVVDNRSNSGMKGTILVFDYDNDKKTFNYAGTMNYEDYFRNPNKYGIPAN